MPRQLSWLSTDSRTRWATARAGCCLLARCKAETSVTVNYSMLELERFGCAGSEIEGHVFTCAVDRQVHGPSTISTMDA